MDQLDHIKDVCLRMQDLCADGGIPPYDRVRLTTHEGKDELQFLWTERKLVVAVTLDDGPERLAAALAQATAGDAVLN